MYTWMLVVEGQHAIFINSGGKLLVCMHIPKLDINEQVYLLLPVLL
jgi:hypothetical protein